MVHARGRFFASLRMTGDEPGVRDVIEADDGRWPGFGGADGLCGNEIDRAVAGTVAGDFGRGFGGAEAPRVLV